MKKSIAMKWVRALRSGKYKQGKQALKPEPNRYCCLGVLCEISKLGKFQGKYFLGASGKLPLEVKQWAQMKTPEGSFLTESRLIKKIKGTTSLSSLNDDGKRFSTIANVIEENYELL